MPANIAYLVLLILLLVYAAVGIFFMIRGIIEAFHERHLSAFGKLCVMLLCTLFIVIWGPLWIYYEVKAARYEAKHLDKSGRKRAKSGTQNSERG